MRIVVTLLLAGALISAGGYAQSPEPASVYTWIDAAGNTHYGDRPPEDVPVRQLDSTALQPSVIGDSALRGGERDLLRQLRAEQQLREQRRAEQAALQRQSQTPDVTIINNVPARANRPRYRRPYYPNYYHYPHRDRYQPRQHGAVELGINLDLDFGITPKGKRVRPALNRRTQRPKSAGSAIPRTLGLRAGRKSSAQPTITRRPKQPR